MRAIADRFPAALREWDEAPPEEITRRRVLAERARDEIRAGSAGVEVALAGDERAFLRYGLAVHRRLRKALEVKRFLSSKRPSAARLRAAADRFALDPEAVAAIAAPPSGRVSEEVYREVALELGVPVAQLKATLFPRRPAAIPVAQPFPAALPTIPEER